MDDLGEKMKQRAQDLRVRAKNFKKPRNVTVQQCPSCVCAGKRGTAETPSRLENYIVGYVNQPDRVQVSTLQNRV